VGERELTVDMKDNSIASQVFEKKIGKISMITLDNLLKDKGPVSYIKADLEGWEVPMLKGAEKTIKKFKPKISITCYHEPNDYLEMVEIIKKAVPEYNYCLKGITQFSGKPVMIHFWIPENSIFQ